MFTSEAAISIDAKGRAAIPTRFRADIEDACANRLVLTYSAENNGSIWLYPRPYWEKVCQNLLAIKRKTPQIRRTRLRLINSAQEVEPDASGRIVLPPRMRESTQLDKHAIFMGAGPRFEIWNEQALATIRGDFDDFADFDNEEIDPELDAMDY